ncbi:TFIIB-type zinc ribbon-containing protein [Cryptosporangium japonicum]|uniref:TFIIB-type zinc ribbon-containing protein n=1 Tax=Cryptosporangium japonicum TaxID=80872 RepID=A0ABP3E5I8_9ACTN
MDAHRDRFRDPRGRLTDFAGFDVLVVCPRCGGCAVSRPLPGDAPALVRPRRLTCPGCGRTASWGAGGDGPHRGGVVVGGDVDPHFRLPLWLRDSCCGGHVLWAWNAEHLDVLEDYVAARRRERGTVAAGGRTSMLEKLPTWMKTAKNRDELGRTLRRLRATLP